MHLRNLYKSFRLYTLRRYRSPNEIGASNQVANVTTPEHHITILKNGHQNLYCKSKINLLC